MTFSLWLVSVFGRDTSGGTGVPGRRPERDSPDRDPLVAPDFRDRLRDGDPTAYETLFVATYAGLVRFATRLVRSQDIAEDLVMDVFRRVWERRKHWDPRDPRVYLYGAIRNAAATAERDRTTRVELLARSNEPVGGSAIVTEDIHQKFVEQERIESLRIAVEQLPERQRLAFTLRREQGLTNAEVAEILGIAIKTVEKELTAALKTLRSALSEFREP